MKPEGVECPNWIAKQPGERRCCYYHDNGACLTSQYFMCIEWMQKNYGFRSALEYRQKQEQDADSALVRLNRLTERARSMKKDPKAALAALKAMSK